MGKKPSKFRVHLNDAVKCTAEMNGYGKEDHEKMLHILEGINERHKREKEED